MAAGEQTKIRQVLERITSELRDEETREEFEELRNKRTTWEDVVQAIKDAPPEARQELRAILADELAGDPPPPTTDPPPPKDPPAPAPPKDDPTKPKRRTRPGRKSNMAYDWGIDEETGEVVKAPMAYIYTGEDEPDEVELMPATRDADDDEGES